MDGLPSWAMWLALTAALVLSLWGLLRGAGWFGSERVLRWDLTAWRPLRRALAWRPLQFVVQVPLVAILVLILWAGFDGTPVPERNIATVLTWSVWWTLLIIDIVLLGRLWCLVCPWEAVAAWLRRLAFWRRSDEPLALDWKWPRWLRNVYPATLLFIGLTWLELGYGVTMSPRATAALGLLMVLLAVVPALFFERRSFCKYGCLIGRVVGIYSMIAPIEVRPRDQSVCHSCETKDCLQGNENGYPCPTGLCVGTLSSNTYCTVCTECFKTCPHDNVALRARPWCADLHTVRKPRRDEAMLALVLVSMTSFHGLTMTPTWTKLQGAVMREAGLSPLASFSLLMVAILVLPVALYLAANWLIGRLGATSDRGPADRLWWHAGIYAYPLVAVALMYHLAHNAGHFLSEVAAVVPVLSDPFGSGADLFGTAGFVPKPLVSMPVVWGFMILLVLIGHHWAVRALERAHRSYAERRGRTRLPLRQRFVVTLLPLAVTAANLWLLAQPMEMRTGM